jgi:exodeoxyribonuclease V
MSYNNDGSNENEYEPAISHEEVDSQIKELESKFEKADLDHDTEVADKLIEKAEQEKPQIKLTDEQQLAIDKIVNWLKIPTHTDPVAYGQEFKLGGYAGTGKTTILKHLINVIKQEYGYVVCAFTGKAVSVLKRKGVPAQTIHSLIYNADVDPKTGAVTFTKRFRLETDPDLIIVDEASMISTELYNDMLAFGKKMLYVGDPGQLEPVGDNPNLMLVPDFILSKIHRQAEQSPIITLANLIRNGGKMNYGMIQDSVEVRQKQLKASEAVLVDQIICAKNKTRTGLNQNIRRFKGFLTELVEGEKIIVLRNNLNRGVFNGLVLFVDEIKEQHHNHWMVNAHDETDQKYSQLRIWSEPFKTPELHEKKSGLIIPRDKDGMQLVYADYGYAITCHKSQGSEWSHVLVMDEWMPPSVWDMKRWRYTAITRASERLTYLL